MLLAGTSAGALCWHEGGPTSGFGEVRTVHDGLGFIPGSLGVHYDSQAERRPALRRAVDAGTLPGGFGLNEGTAVLYEGDRAVDFVTERAGSVVYRVDAHVPRADAHARALTCSPDAAASLAAEELGRGGSARPGPPPSPLLLRSSTRTGPHRAAAYAPSPRRGRPAGGPGLIRRPPASPLEDRAPPRAHDEGPDRGPGPSSSLRERVSARPRRRTPSRLPWPPSRGT